MEATEGKPAESEVPKFKSQALKKKGSTRNVSTVPAHLKHTPENVIMFALQNGWSKEDIQFLYDKRNEELARVALLDFNEAKSKFLKLVPKIVKNREANFGETKSGAHGASYRFSDLDNLINTVKDAESAAGLSHDWETGTDEKGWLTITCILSHVGGHSKRDTMKAQPDATGGKNAIQAMKSTVSYLRRGTLESVLGLPQGGDDNDGRDAPGNSFVSDLPAVTAEGYKILLNSIRAGTMTLEQAQKTYYLTPEQIDSLRLFDPPQNANP